MSAFKLMEVQEFKDWLSAQKVSRKIRVLQLHHTYSPSYKNFKGNNHEALQRGMRSAHLSRGFTDIAQQFTIFPDGKIMTGRSLNTAPAGIYGCNTQGICIECLGNFDIGGDNMTEAQKKAIPAYVKILLDRFSLNARTDVTYHAWWTSTGKALGDYILGKSAKTCPGTAFFGGNSKAAYEKNFLPLIENYGKEGKKIMIESGNDIVWELMNGKYHIEINDVQRAIKQIDNAKIDGRYSSLYWILYKLVNN